MQHFLKYLNVRTDSRSQSDREVSHCHQRYCDSTERSTGDFVFTFHRIYGSMLYHFRDIAGYLSKVSHFPYRYLTCVWRPVRGPHWDFTQVFGIRKQDPSALVRRYLNDVMFNHYGRTLTCDRRTDTGL